jgi:hypothetical protein
MTGPGPTGSNEARTEVVPSACLPSSYEVYRIHADGSKETRLNQDDLADYDPYYSPSGKQIAWLRSISRAVGDLSDGSRRQRPAAGNRRRGINSKPAWRHDGSAIVFHRIPPNTPAGSFSTSRRHCSNMARPFRRFLLASSLHSPCLISRMWRAWNGSAMLPFHAPDAEPMDGARLAEVPVDHLDRVVLHLHPSAGLLVSPYPVFSIWRTNSMDADVRAIGPEMSGEAALVLRPKLEVGSILLPPGGAAFISAIADGNGLARAAEQAAADAPDFALAETLGTCLARGLFTGFALKGGVL